MEGDYKMRVSRSLTELQQSLDEACRLGLPTGVRSVVRGREQQQRSDGSAAGDLERLLAVDSAMMPRRRSVSAAALDAGPADREMYLSVLREHQIALTTTDKASLAAGATGVVTMTRRSRSWQNSRPATSAARTRSEQPCGTAARTASKNKLRHACRPLMQHQSRREAVRSQVQTSSDHDSSGGDIDPCDAVISMLTSRNARYREREQELVRELEAMIETVEQSRWEQTQAELARTGLESELAAANGRLASVVRSCEERVRATEAEVPGIVTMASAASAARVTEVATAATGIICERCRVAEIEIEEVRMTVKVTEGRRQKSQEESATRETVVMLQRDDAEARAEKWRNELESERRKRETETKGYREELQDLRSRMVRAESEQVRLTTERGRLLENIQSATAQAELHKQAERKLKKLAASEATNSLEVQRARSGESHLQTEISRLREEYDTAMAAADSVMRGQMRLVAKLRMQLGSSVELTDQSVRRVRQKSSQEQWQLQETSRELAELRQSHTALTEEVLACRANLEEAHCRLAATENSRTNQQMELLAAARIANESARAVETANEELQRVRKVARVCECGLLSAIMDSPLLPKH